MTFSLIFMFAATQSHSETPIKNSPSMQHVMGEQVGGAEQNKKEGEQFMQTNQQEKGVVTLPSGLQYKILEPGSGPKPKVRDRVQVHYEGKLLNGTVFDSSYKRNEPLTIPVSGVIAGWQEALQLMNTGAVWMLYIPPNLAYGEQGAGGVIGPNETLVFKVHLISIQ